MATLRDLLTRVHDELPAVPEELALRALSDATKEFCSRSHAWQGFLPNVRFRPDRTAYELYPDEGVQVASILDVRVRGRKIRPVSAGSPRLLNHTNYSALSGYSQVSATSILIYGSPAETASAAVFAALTLVMGAKDVELPDAFVDEHGIGIAAGARSKLCMMGSVPWASPSQAGKDAAEFYRAIGDAKQRVWTSLGAVQSRVQMRDWA